MTLNAYAASKRLAILEDLKQKGLPGEGEYDETALAAGKVKGEPQLGSTRFEPDAILVEFIYPDPASSATILTVKLTPPERIVYLPVPEWVVESIWQGEISGSFHFESDARGLLAELENELSPEQNSRWFHEGRSAVGRS